MGPALVSLIIGVFALFGVERLADARDAVTRSRDIAESMLTVMARLTDAETAQRGYLLTGSHLYLEPGTTASADVHRSLAAAHRLVADTTEQKRLDTLSSVIASKLAELDSARRAYDGPGGLSQAAALVRSDRGEMLMMRARFLSNSIVLAERERLARRETHERELTIFTVAAVFASILLAGFLSLLANATIDRALTAREKADRRRQETLDELQRANTDLADQASEMEAQAVELEQANEDLRSVTLDLEQQTATAERASERVKNVLDTMSDAFIAFNRDWTITQLNVEGERLTRTPAAQLIGQSIWKVWGPMMPAELESRMREAMTVSNAVPAPFEFEVAPGYWFDIRMNATRDGLAIFFRDVTLVRRERMEREQLIEKAEAEHRRLLTVVEQSPLAISIIDASTGQRIIANRAAEAIFGISLGFSLHETTDKVKAFHADGRAVQLDEWPMARALAGGEVVIGEIVEIERPDGSRRRICVNSSPVRDAHGKVDAGVTIFWDVTEQHEAEQELRNARLEAESASRAKSEFLAVMSHELRTPLSAIIGYEELLYDGITGPVNDGQRTQLGRIKASATHLLSLIDEVLTLSRVEAGREITHPERIPVYAAMHEAVALAEPLAAEKGLILIVKKAPPTCAVWADSTKLRQILLNLLTNAIKFTDTGTVVVDSEVNESTIVIAVRDTGIGIALSDHDRVFDTFWQVEQKSTRKVGGTGLGLSVSRRLARLMKGELTVSSRLGEGSTFRLKLPAA